jgi:hypothetical protein
MTQAKISTKYRIHGPNVLSFQEQEGSVVDKVPAGYYKVEFHPFMGYYLTRVSDTVAIPEQIFGSTLPRVKRIFESYAEAEGSLGVGLFGKKGAGKSLLASVVANKAITLGLPVIDVSDSFKTDSDYLEFLNSIEECVIVFDEFLKHLSKLDAVQSPDSDTYERNNQRKSTASDRQDEMLTFFQGTHNRKRLIMLIDNQQYMLSEFLTDRPGRMRYMYVYEGVEREVVEALAKHHGIPEDKTQQLVMYSIKYRVSFDVVNEIIKEWSRYPEETLEQLTEVLNVPTLRPVVTTKVRVVSYTPDPTHEVNGKSSLVSELGTMDSNGLVNITIERPNDMYNSPLLSKEEHEDSAYDYMDYDVYLEERKKPTETLEFRANTGDLVGIKGNRSMYTTSGVSFVIETLDTVTENSSFSWSNAF